MSAKSIRRSSIKTGKVKTAQAISVDAQQDGLKTNMRLAFERIKVKDFSQATQELRTNVINALTIRNAGMSKQTKGWNVKCSYRTYTALKAMGVPL